MPAAPHVHIDPQAFRDDPYPALARMRAEWEAWSATLSEPRFVMAQAQNPERLAGVQAMIRSYVETGEPGVDPRTLLYGGGPE